FRIRFFRINHNIPDGVGLAINTPAGLLVYATDWKFDHTPVDGRPTEFDKLAKFGGEGVALLMSDSTNAEKPGYSMSEKTLGDTCVVSASPIPGNERAVSSILSNLARLGARVLYQKILDIHTSGHAYQEDLKLMISLTKPKNFMPIHGEHHMLVAHAQLAKDV